MARPSGQCSAYKLRRRLEISRSPCVLSRVQKDVRPAEYAELSVLFFVQAMAMGVLTVITLAIVIMTSH